MKRLFRTLLLQAFALLFLQTALPVPRAAASTAAPGNENRKKKPKKHTMKPKLKILKGHHGKKHTGRPA